MSFKNLNKTFFSALLLNLQVLLEGRQKKKQYLKLNY